MSYAGLAQYVFPRGANIASFLADFQTNHLMLVMEELPDVSHVAVKSDVTGLVLQVEATWPDKDTFVKVINTESGQDVAKDTFALAKRHGAKVYFPNSKEGWDPNFKAATTLLDRDL